MTHSHSHLSRRAVRDVAPIAEPHMEHLAAAWMCKGVPHSGSPLERRLDDAIASATTRGVLSDAQCDRMTDALAEERTTLVQCLADIEAALLPCTASDVTAEVVRAESMLMLRKEFERHVTEITGLPPANEAFNAWLFVQLARSHAAGIVDGTEHLFVPLVTPGRDGTDDRCGKGSSDGGGGGDGSSDGGGHAWPLVKYFVRARTRGANLPPVTPVEMAQLEATSTALAEACDAWLRQQWEGHRERVRLAVAGARRECSRQHADVGISAERLGSTSPSAPPEAAPRLPPDAADPPEAITSYRVCGGASNDGSSYRVWLEPRPQRQRSEHIVNAACLAKLRAGYVGAPADFDCRLFVLLHRYASVFGPRSSEGRGWQLATPPAAMDSLSADFGVDAECFASPFNRRQPHFCSAFLDTDAPFGSSGNFFAAAHRGSLQTLESAEGGPPYDDQLMMMAVRAIDAELTSRQRAGRPGSFVLVVPDWREPPSAFWSAAQRSEHLAHVLVLEKHRHRYLDGFQHLASSARARYIMGETATLLIWLQNDVAASLERFAVTEDKLAHQRAAWDVPERLT